MRMRSDFHELDPEWVECGHMTKMATMPIYGKDFRNPFCRTCIVDKYLQKPSMQQCIISEFDKIPSVALTSI